ncbi:MAG: hypothetical protein J7L63_00415 [Thermoplasmata archaeon]|nr:hypothetical protein [Thermoplasmata archaeon]
MNTTNDPTDPAKELRDLVQDCMSPEAVAAIVAYLQPAHCGDEQVDRQIQWFAEQLVEALGGDDAFNRVCDELGL